MLRIEASRHPLACHHASLFQTKTLSTRITRREASSTKNRQRGLLVTCSSGNGDRKDEPEPTKDEKVAVDWDKAWSGFRKQRKSSFFSKFNMDKYVTRSPQHQNYPLSEEVDPFKKLEKSTLRLWTDPKFTVTGFAVIAGLFVYMVIIVGAPPTK